MIGSPPGRDVRGRHVPVRVRVGHPLLADDRPERAELLDAARGLEVVEDRLVPREALEAHHLLGEERPVLAELDVPLARDVAHADVEGHRREDTAGAFSAPTVTKQQTVTCAVSDRTARVRASRVRQSRRGTPKPAGCVRSRALDRRGARAGGPSDDRRTARRAVRRLVGARRHPRSPPLSTDRKTESNRLSLGRFRIGNPAPIRSGHAPGAGRPRPREAVRPDRRAAGRRPRRRRRRARRAPGAERRRQVHARQDRLRARPRERRRGGDLRRARRHAGGAGSARLPRRALPLPRLAARARGARRCTSG